MDFKIMKKQYALKTKITSSEYQKLDISDQDKYSRFCGSDEVYYILISYVKSQS